MLEERLKINYLIDLDTIDQWIYSSQKSRKNMF